MTDLRTHLQDSLGSAYRIDRELGGGGMSRVFLAEETALGRRVVVKVLPTDLAAGVNVERFRREIQLSAKLQHPHIVPVLTCGELDGVPYYTMPFVEGQSLRKKLEKGPLPISEILTVLRDLARALAYAHDQGVAHRDIKPDNILLSGGSATVADFGIAKALTAARADEAGATLTQVGISIGTPAYMAPEQAAADPSTNHRADIYAYGCVAYELLAGRPPFVERNPQRLLAAHMSDQPEPIQSLRPDTPAVLAELVMRALSKEADDRPQTAAEIIRSLESVTSGGPLPALPPILLGGVAAPRRAFALYAVAFVAVGFLARVAVNQIGLPGWVFPGAIGVMLMGLPVLLLTAWAQRVALRSVTSTPTFTPGGTATGAGTMATLAMKASPHLSWRRATLGGAWAVGGFVALVGAYMTLRALGVGPVGSLLAAGKLNTREPLLIASFNVSGADSTLSDVMREAVQTNLTQSRAISIVPASRISAALRRMQQAPSAKLTPALAHDVAEREGIKGVVGGDMRPLGTGYVVTLRLTTGQAQDVLASFSRTIGSEAELLGALDGLSKDLRGKIGESLKQVNASPKLEEVSTPSIDALRKYAAAVQAIDMEGDNRKGVALLREAVAHDSTFAMAWRKMSAALWNIRMPRTQVEQSAAKAYQYRDRLTERERLMTDAWYFSYGPVSARDRRKTAAAYERMLDLDPADRAAANNLANVLQSRREYARAESLHLAILAREPGRVQQYVNLSELQVTLGKLDAADSTLTTGIRLFPEAAQLPPQRLSLYYARGQIDSMFVMLRGMHDGRNEEQRARGAWGIADLSILHGKLNEGSRWAIEGARLETARGTPQTPLAMPFADAEFDIWWRGKREQGVQRVRAAIARHPFSSIERGRRPYFWAANLYSLGGRPDLAREVVDMARADVRDSAEALDMQPSLHRALGEIALAERRPLDALREFRLSDQRPDGPVGGCTICPLASYGRAYDLANQPDSAIAMFEAYLNTSLEYRWEYDYDGTLLAPILKRLGELYEQTNHPAKAIPHYERFVALWKDADPDLQPRVAEVRQRLARLRAGEAARR